MTGPIAATLNLLEVRRIVGSRQKAELRELQLLCLPKDAPVECAKSGCSFAMYDGGRMIAFGLARRSVGYQKTMYLSRAGVHPDYRGRGLQKELIRLREEWANNHGLRYSITDTSNCSVSSMASLIAMGYAPFWPVLTKPWALKKSVYWKKELSEEQLRSRV